MGISSFLFLIPLLNHTCFRTRLGKREKRTADVLIALGIPEYSTGHLRAGTEALRVDSSELFLLSDIIAKWSSSVEKAYEKELRALKLL